MHAPPILVTRKLTDDVDIDRTCTIMLYPLLAIAVVTIGGLENLLPKFAVNSAVPFAVKDGTDITPVS